MSVEIRRFRTGDGVGAYDTFVRSVRELGAVAYTPEQIEAWLSGMTSERLEGRLRSMVSFVAEEEGRIVGFASLDTRHAELDFLYIHPDWARQGLGRKLAERIENAAKDARIARLFIVASLNAKAVYERLGYDREYDMEKMIDGVKVPCIRMFKGMDR